MKKILVVGDYHDNLTKALEKAKAKKLIDGYLNYFDYLNSVDSNENGLPKAIYNNELDYVLSLVTDTFAQDYIVMKGKIHSNDFLRIIIEINKRLTDKKVFLSHCAVLEKERVKFILTDAAFNLQLTRDNQIDVYNNVVDFYHKYTKKENEPIVNYVLAECNYKIPNFDLAEFFPSNVQPAQVDTALDINRAKFKNGTDNQKADILIVPDINMGNAIWKTATVLADFTASGFVVGTEFICLLNSRGDSEKSFFRSIVNGLKL